ncbi:unnamed protein product [Ambrosiozyma monospora]|uniref:Unnamed protein product n=1 Tax=Ambrosiozyma monospora TaxID=43982 RepID=A0ACB5UBA0_AMBMO|nr:unnamed protein product [Ambrosiozyma monospora]
MIQILSELFETDEFYDNIPVQDMLKLTKLLEQSYKFSKLFNEDYNLRVRIWNSGVIDRLPNLLKQETASSGVFISMLFRLYCDSEKVDDATRKTITETLVPLCVSILQRFVSLDEMEQSRNIQSWRPVIIEILQVCSRFDKGDFEHSCPDVYQLIIALFDKSLTDDMRIAMKEFFNRVGEIYVGEGSD